MTVFPVQLANTVKMEKLKVTVLTGTFVRKALIVQHQRMTANSQIYAQEDTIVNLENIIHVPLERTIQMKANLIKIYIAYQIPF